MLRHWSQFAPNISTDIRGHEALHHHLELSRTVYQAFALPSLPRPEVTLPGKLQALVYDILPPRREVPESDARNVPMRLTGR